MINLIRSLGKSCHSTHCNPACAYGWGSIQALTAESVRSLSQLLLFCTLQSGASRHSPVTSLLSSQHALN